MNNQIKRLKIKKVTIQAIYQLKRGDRKKEPKDYQLLKWYDVVQIGNTVKLIYPVVEGSPSMKCYVVKEDIFEQKASSFT